MFDLFKLAFPAVGVALVIYLAITPKMWARPWTFFALAMVVLILSFGFHLAIDELASTLDSLKPGVHHLADIKHALSLVDVVVGSLAGALIGVAVTNRAMRLNSDAVRELQEQADRYAKEANDAKQILGAIGPNPSGQDGIRKRKAAEHQFIQATMDLHEILDKKRKYTL